MKIRLERRPTKPIPTIYTLFLNGRRDLGRPRRQWKQQAHLPRNVQITTEQTLQFVVLAVTAVSDSFDLRSTDTRDIRTGDVTCTHSSALPHPLETLAQRLHYTTAVLLHSI